MNFFHVITAISYISSADAIKNAVGISRAGSGKANKRTFTKVSCIFFTL